ncbi:isochorismate synthase [Anoxybacteroides rupiense]|uniref:isochorismate synthase n=1 Tax=Anoxybacteroides rupiense TaxID=311460 RepID=UPI001F08D3C2
MATLYQHQIRKKLEMITKSACQPFVSWSGIVPSIAPVYLFKLGETSSFSERFYWSDRSNEVVYAGIGCTYVIDEEGDGPRFSIIEEKWNDFLNMTEVHGEEEKATPVLFGGFSFDPLKKKTDKWTHFSNAKFIVPTVLLSLKKDCAMITITVPSKNNQSMLEEIDRLLGLLYTKSFHPTSSLPRCVTYEEIRTDEWIHAVRQIIDEIQQGSFDKVVLAREVRLQFDGQLTPSAVLEHLCEQQPFSYLFAFEQAGSCFIGASPEQLVKKEEHTFYSTCLAGSIRRGRTSSEDESLGQVLLQDEKNLHEHRFVVEMIRQAMQDVCEDVKISPEPQLLKMRDIQHLYTPVIGKSDSRVSLLSVVERLHPTPALGGAPKEKALEMIREAEPLDRGWYAAPIGWMNAMGDGEFAVAIRSGLLQGNEAFLFAGCGVVGDSEPFSEYEETNVKLKPMLSALGVKQDER